MYIIVCIKQVPEAGEVKIDPRTHTLIREGVKSQINPFDLNAIEEALRLKEKHDAKVTVITMGPPQAEQALREALAMGVDDALLLSDRAFAGSDTLATSYALAAAIRKLGRFDLVICGKQAIDGDTAQVGPGIAERLGIPQITYVRELHIDNGLIKAKRMLEDGYEWLQAPLPALVTVVKQINEPRYPSLKGILQARKAEIPVWTPADIDADLGKIGFDGSPTRVIKIFTPQRERQAEIFTGNLYEIVEKVINMLKENELI